MTLTDSSRDSWVDRDPSDRRRPRGPATDDPRSSSTALHVPMAARPDGLPERRSLDRVNLLARSIDHVCRTAVDPLEIAAALESRGINDQVARTTFKMTDVFHLAEQIFQRVPRRATYVPIVTPSGGTFAALARGLMFGIPGLFYLVVLHGTSSRAATWVLLGTSIAGWGITQAMSYLGYQVLGRSGVPATQIFLRTWLIDGIVVAVLMAEIAALIGAPMWLVVMAGAQLVYVLAATVMLLLERDIWLAIALAPGALATLAYVLSGHGDRPASWVLATLGTSIALATIFAFVLTAAGSSADRVRLASIDYRRAVPFLLYGALAAALLAIGAADGFPRARDSGRSDLAMFPLILSMGFAEWQLRSYRRRTTELLHRSVNVDDFGDYAWRWFVVALSWYFAGIVMLTTVGAFVFPVVSDSVTLPTQSLVAFGVLGAGFFVGLVLIASLAVSRVVIALVTAIVFYVLARVEVHAAGLPISNARLYLCASAIFLVQLIISASAHLRRPLVHR